MCKEDKRIIQTAEYPSYQRLVSNAGSLAIETARRAGLPITFVENNQIIKEFNDGSRQILGSVSSGSKVKGGILIISNER